MLFPLWIFLAFLIAGISFGLRKALVRRGKYRYLVCAIALLGISTMLIALMATNDALSFIKIIVVSTGVCSLVVLAWGIVSFWDRIELRWVAYVGILFGSTIGALALSTYLHLYVFRIWY